MKKIGEIWVGWHSDLGVVIYDQRELMKNGKYQFRLWVDERGTFVNIGREVAREQMLKPPDDDLFLKKCEVAVERYNSRNNTGRSSALSLYCSNESTSNKYNDRACGQYWTGVTETNGLVLIGYQSESGEPFYLKPEQTVDDYLGEESDEDSEYDFQDMVELKCHDCDGKGVRENVEEECCPYCGGRGKY